MVDEINVIVEPTRPTILMRFKKPIPHAFGLGRELALLDQARDRVGIGFRGRHNLRAQPICLDPTLQVLAWSKVRTTPSMA